MYQVLGTGPKKVEVIRSGTILIDDKMIEEME